MDITIITLKLAFSDAAFSVDVSKTKYKRFLQNIGIKAALLKTGKVWKDADLVACDGTAKRQPCRQR